ncbi:hypothetical protein [Leucobacter ruminantium]|uniref:Uncharacterized protein n=1 Tax=Leucobacter ruminantium TaxID=1289170 RepID=A0A939LWY6_9MICO|nr:hypothetical protein [Leucobacter ruminantium]MBO1805962.1 hypothetical protein [Leucobacter ruminantium]
MTETGVVAIIGMVATVIGAVAGPVVTTRADKSKAENERAEQRRQEQVELLAQTLTALKRYSQMQFAYLRIIAQLPREQVREFVKERIDSEPMKELWTFQREAASNISRAQITIRDERISSALEQLDDELAFASEELEAELNAREEELHLAAARVAYVERKQDDFTQAILELELAARAVLASDLK